MDRLNNLVVEHLADRLFNPKRLSAILVAAATLRAEKFAEVDGRLSALRAEVLEADEKLKRLYKMVEASARIKRGRRIVAQSNH